MQTTTVSQPPADSAVQALLHRAHTGLLFNALDSQRAEYFGFWRGYAKALRDLQSAKCDKLAAKDAALAGYQLPSALQAAADFLGVDVYSLSHAEAVKRLAIAGIKFPAEDVAELDVSAAHELEHAAVPAVNQHGEHAAHTVDGNNDALGHGDSLNTKEVILTQGGAA